MVMDFSIVYLANVSWGFLMLWFGLAFFLTFMTKEWLFKFLGMVVTIIVLLTCISGTYAMGDILIIVIVLIVQFMLGVYPFLNDE
jgi:hypothetical protein